jgi:peptidoglycan-associated lipoprotein
MKILYTFLLLFSFIFQGISQDSNSKKADKLFANKQYHEAAVEYQKASESYHVLSNLADCLLHSNQLQEAVAVYSKLLVTYEDSLLPQNYFNYAQALMKMGDYTKSDPIMSLYLKYNIITPNFLYNLKSLVPFAYDIQMMSKSNTNGDFGVKSFENQVIYASAKKVSTPNYAGNVEPNYDLVVADINKIGLIIDSKSFSKELNSKLHESDATFSIDGKVVYFCRTEDKKAKASSIHFATKSIYKSELVNGIWTKGKKLPFCDKTFSTESPNLSRDGKRLYFSSNREGSIGGFDIFYVTINSDGTYGNPVNLGKGINTIQDEKYPFISDNNSLFYFSSNGHQGMGGLDIYSCDVFGEEYQNVLNLGGTINSNWDDFGFSVSNTTDSGYMTSNRENGNTNLYSFKRTKNEMNFFVQGNVIDKNTKNPLPNTNVVLFDMKGVKVAELVSSNKTEFILKAKPNTKYLLKAINNLYYPFEEEIITTNDGKVRYTIELFKIIN